ncbi:hypothetical protein EJ04DRAFT_536118 [Polyplosphaeria fusca]|uniref:BYS1 domain protein n=1 Tax=Polyplosphaeria fusca TaxID=682080 RepID=A0A9P4QWP4_9PLEO|nr:hypothetical protein EJ04DRAFT_536118 [Polyplosphaeria fusca]
MYLAIFSLVALVSTASAIGNAAVVNKCDDPFYLWSVGGAIGPMQVVSPGGLYAEPLHRDPRSGGVAIKITAVDNGLLNGAAQLIFAYTVDGDQVWYDLSDVFGEPFSGKRLKVSSNGGASIDWPNGTRPLGSQVKNTASTDDVVFVACA